MTYSLHLFADAFMHGPLFTDVKPQLQNHTCLACCTVQPHCRARRLRHTARLAFHRVNAFKKTGDKEAYVVNVIASREVLRAPRDLYWDFCTSICRVAEQPKLPFITFWVSQALYKICEAVAAAE